jgi:N-methylhydantoinase A/oxoprolinase/acetone carboxylase beta subunit
MRNQPVLPSPPGERLFTETGVRRVAGGSIGAPGRQRLALSFDVGGTFTDFSLVDLTTGRVVAEHKTLTDAADPGRSSLAGWRDLVAQGHLRAADLVLVVHATTLVTNAVIERTGATTALLTTAGMRDLLAFGREQMYDIYDLFAPPAVPLVPRERRVEVAERVTRDGVVLHPLVEEEVIAALAPLVAAGVEAVAIGFLHSYRQPDHEERAAEAIARVYPGIEISLSSRVAPLIGEYERFSTTVADAYVKRRVRAAIGGLRAAFRDEGLPANVDLHVMLSSGGIAAAAEAIERPIRLLESGPAAGALAAAFHGALAGRDRILAFDMGGTTAKACLIDGGRPALARGLEIARVHRFKPGSGLPVTVPVVDLIEIGAGGGSIARVDELGLLKVGPRSAGADPGPACYGRGGTAPTVTDANLLLGYLDEGSFLGGRMRLDRAAAHDALTILGSLLGGSALDAAWGVHRVANEAMAAAARMHAIEHNRDPRHFTLLAFGGAGPAHAGAVARVLGIQEVIFPPGAGVAASLGCLVAPPTWTQSRTAVGQLDRLDWTAVRALLVGMESEGRTALAAAGVRSAEIAIERSVDLRLSGQYHELTVLLPGGEVGEVGEVSDSMVPALSTRFADTYTEQYGRMLTGLPIEAVTWRMEARGPEGRVQLQPAPLGETDASAAMTGQRPVFFGEPHGWRETPVYARDRLTPGARLTGPAIVEEAAATAVLHPGNRGEITAYGALIVQRGVET